VPAARAAYREIVHGSLKRPFQSLRLRSLGNGRRCYFVADSARTRQGIT
jgi:hypothetical protein